MGCKKSKKSPCRRRSGSKKRTRWITKCKRTIKRTVIAIGLGVAANVVTMLAWPTPQSPVRIENRAIILIQENSINVVVLPPSCGRY